MMAKYSIHTKTNKKKTTKLNLKKKLKLKKTKI